MGSDTATTTRAGLVRVFLPLGLAFLAVGLSVALFVPFLSLFLSTEVHASPIQVTVFLITGPLAGVLVASRIARLSDRRPIRRKLMIGAAVIGVVGCLLTAVIRDYWVLLALQVTAIAIAGSLFPQSFAYAREVLQRDLPERAAMGITALRTVFSIAWVAGPPLASLLIETGGFRLVYVVAAATYATAAVVAALGLPEVRPAGVRGETDAGIEPPPSRGRQILITAAFTALQCPLTLGVQALPLFISEDLGGRVSDAGLILGLCAALEIPLLLGMGWLTTRVPVRSIIVGGAACGVVYFLIAASAGAVWVLLAAQIVNALFIAAISGPSISFVQDMMPDQPGRATTLFTNTFPIGAMLAGPLLGVAARFDYRWAFAMNAALCALGLVLLLAMRTRRSPRVP
ncbi:sugar efflux transporter [Actinoplanes sp. NPDC051633]|uniref:sugar efflux transporter n=1 Tax=Actinoplanes sp. NPDC051633 TaxID=3155670 RepID=UPI00342562EF